MADDSLHYPLIQATQFCVKTNLPVTTSMRAPGVVQAVHATEMVLAEVARELGLPMQAVQEANFLKVRG
jgi:CO/xanthine dehydrogenase Mo-binding subunit